MEIVTTHADTSSSLLHPHRCIVAGKRSLSRRFLSLLVAAHADTAEDVEAPLEETSSDSDSVTPPRLRSLAALARRRRCRGSAGPATGDATLKISLEEEDKKTAVVRLGDVAVETTFSVNDVATKHWMRQITSLTRSRRLRAPLVVGLVALSGHASSADIRSRGQRFRPSSTIRGIALCVGGSHVLVYQPNAAWDLKTSATGKISFHKNSMKLIREFLSDARITVACLDADGAGKTLAKAWGLHVAHPVDLNSLVERAYGEHVVVDVLVSGRREKGSLVVKTLNIEEMALLVLGRDMVLKNMPIEVVQADWGSAIGRVELKYATRDAYLSFEIALRCLVKLGVPTGA